MKKSIPIFNQSSEAIGGIHIVKLSTEDTDYHAEKLEAHRDNFFIFFVLTSGKVQMHCDTIEVELNAVGIGFIKPFQVHSVKQISIDATGYFISIAPFLIPDLCLEIFQNLEISEQGRKIEDSQTEDLLNHISLLHNFFSKEQSNKPQIINGLFSALVYNFSNLFQSSEKRIAEHKNQSALIAVNFKKLIYQHSFLESPSFFAKNLNISPSHLNDCVNATTGKSVTYWLQNAMIIEAQRLLYYTENDVKEIAYNLGFEDHSYFSRLFKKLCNETPLAFRKRFRE
jgi:AraC family transcriptional regulator, transcriptional activator of pobA